jgi:hypothetical protein
MDPLAPAGGLFLAMSVNTSKMQRILDAGSFIRAIQI